MMDTEKKTYTCYVVGNGHVLQFSRINIVCMKWSTKTKEQTLDEYAFVQV